MLLRNLFNGLSVVYTTGAYSVLVAAALPFDEGGHKVTGIARRWARRVNQLCGVKVRVSGLDQPFGDQAYLLMANHSSHFDLLGLYSVMPVDARPVAKRELGKIPLFGWVLRGGAAIMIDRGDREKARQSIERAGETIRAGQSVLMFPEGTRTAGYEVGPLKKGPFHLALAAHVPILPVGIIGSAEVLEPHDWRVNPGHISVRFGAPIETTKWGNDDAGREALQEQVAAALNALVRQGHIPA